MAPPNIEAQPTLGRRRLELGPPSPFPRPRPAPHLLAHILRHLHGLPLGALHILDGRPPGRRHLLLQLLDAPNRRLVLRLVRAQQHLLLADVAPQLRQLAGC
jgi:hypothetical protein